MRSVFTSEFWRRFLFDVGESVLRSIFEIAFIIVLFLIARVVVFRLIDRAMAVAERREEDGSRPSSAARIRTLGGLLKSVSAYVIGFVAFVMIIRAFGVNPWALLTPAAVVGLAVGFGAQKLVKDVITGFFILLENQYMVGEYVTIGTVTGIIEGIEMRTTRIRDDIGRLVIIANGDISQVTNHSRGAIVVTIDVAVDAGSDVDTVCRILRETGTQMAEERADVLEPFTCEGVAAMDSTKITLKLTGKVQPGAKQDIEMSLRKRIRDALMQNGIEIA